MKESKDLPIRVLELIASELWSVEKLWLQLYREQIETQPDLPIDPSGFKSWLDSLEVMIPRFGFVLAAIRDDHPIGFIAGRIKLPTPPFQAVATGFISEIFVISEYRGKSLGSILLAAAERWFTEKEISSMELQVLAGNERAKLFYLTKGWKLSVEHMTRSIGNSNTQ